SERSLVRTAKPSSRWMGAERFGSGIRRTANHLGHHLRLQGQVRWTLSWSNRCYTAPLERPPSPLSEVRRSCGKQELADLWDNRSSTVRRSGRQPTVRMQSSY